MLTIRKYEKRKKKYDILVKKQQRYLNNISILRVSVFILGIIMLLIAYSFKAGYFFGLSILLIIILLIYSGHSYKRIENKKKYIAALYEINETSIKRLNGEWKFLKDTGQEFIDENHNYSYDLDIFGEGSLFQWISVCSTYVGRQKLKEILTEKPNSEQIIYNRQSAIKELAQKISFRQRLEAEGKIISDKWNSMEEVFLWIKERNKNIIKKQIIYGVRILSTITTVITLTLIFRIMAFLLMFLLDIHIFLPSIFFLIPIYIPVTLILIQLIILSIKKEERMKNLIIAEKYRNNIITYKNMLKYIEKHKFKSDYIISLHKKLYNADGQSASKQIDGFSKICEFISNRRNILYHILNPILMIEYHVTISLELWKIKSGNDFEKWINVIAELEALGSLAIIKYDNPYWNMPRIGSGKSQIIAEDMGHPLLGEKRVCNSIKVEEPYSVILITGSNMSGKSTFMRTVGINMVLAYAGAPVCANTFYCTIMDIYTCMKVSDNLGKSISSFYLEMLRIKNIVEASKEGKEVLFLLDEIFKGTNSKDRHTGAEILIRQLSKGNNLGVVSTHDIELGEMEFYGKPTIKNYHFSEYYKNNKIHFDYKLKAGISQTRNAIYLMKLAGIEVEESKK